MDYNFYINIIDILIIYNNIYIYIIIISYTQEIPGMYVIRGL